MISLRAIIDRCFQGMEYVKFRGTELLTYNRKSVYMTVPINEEYLEIPVFAVKGLENIVHSHDIDLESDSLAIELHTSQDAGGYATLDSNIRKIIGTNFSNRLSKLSIKENSDTFYYGTYGALFDKDLNPVMMLVWKVRKRPVSTLENGDTRLFIPIKPIIRVSPEVVQKRNSMERYIFNRIITEGLALTRLEGMYTNVFKYTSELFSTQVIIDKMPFRVSPSAIPSISTTNEELIGTALEYIDEMDQTP